MKKLLSIMLAFLLVFSLGACGSGDSESNGDFGNLKGGSNTLSEFHEKVSESQELLDLVADKIYTNWYDAIYNDKFNEDINLAIASAQVDLELELKDIKELDSEISQLFKKVKDGEQAQLVKDIMSAYSDYYEFVVNVSGSFKSYSADKETLKKNLASLLRDLSYEL